MRRRRLRRRHGRASGPYAQLAEAEKYARRGNRAQAVAHYQAAAHLFRQMGSPEAATSMEAAAHRAAKGGR